jgi:hypothetical protein
MDFIWDEKERIILATGIKFKNNLGLKNMHDDRLTWNDTEKQAAEKNLV